MGMPGEARERGDRGLVGLGDQPPDQVLGGSDISSGDGFGLSFSGDPTNPGLGSDRVPHPGEPLPGYYTLGDSGYWVLESPRS